MASGTSHAHPHGTMVAQPVGTIAVATASFRDSMSSEPGSLAKETTEHMDMSSGLILSDSSPGDRVRLYTTIIYVIP